MYGAGDLMIGWRAVFGATQLKIDPVPGGTNLFARGSGLQTNQSRGSFLACLDVYLPVIQGT